MKNFSVLAACVLSAIPAFAQAAKAKPAKPAAVAQPANPAAQAAKPAGLIDSDLVGRDLSFIAQAIDLGKAMNYLARLAGRTEKPELRGFGDDLVKTLTAQSAVLSTLAEMRKVSTPAGESATQKQIEAKLGKLTGVKLEKAILDAFIDLDKRMIAAYELSANSPDPTIAKFVEQTLPQAKEHLIYVQSMVGIAPKSPPVVAQPPVDAPGGEKAKPAFRANVPLAK